jgi:putative tryptophan/tyrosine transport system substrate-binding protein
MRRREFIAGIGGAAAWPFTLRVEQSAVPVVGFLSELDSEGAVSNPNAAVRAGLSETGYVEGQNLKIEYRYAEHRPERLPELAADLVRRQVAVIVMFTTPPALAAKAATQTVPIVFSIGTDPVAVGLVASLSRPGGNVTGVYNLNSDLAAKRLEVLHEIVPAATSIAHLVNPANPVLAEAEMRVLRAAANVLKVSLRPLDVRSPSELEPAFLTLVGEGVGGVVVAGDGLFFTLRDAIVAQVARHKLPAIYTYRDATVAGGLVSYGTDFPSAWRQAGVYAGRILRGEKPGDLPVQQVTKVRLAVNLKTAGALGITFPLPVRARADEVIE